MSGLTMGEEFEAVLSSLSSSQLKVLRDCINAPNMLDFMKKIIDVKIQESEEFLKAERGSSPIELH